jgi:hypothetical protein
MKVQTRKKSNTAKVISEAILVSPIERDVVFETVEEALVHQATPTSTRKTYTK